MYTESYGERRHLCTQQLYWHRLSTEIELSTWLIREHWYAMSYAVGTSNSLIDSYKMKLQWNIWTWQTSSISILHYWLSTTVAASAFAVFAQVSGQKKIAYVGSIPHRIPSHYVTSVPSLLWVWAVFFSADIVFTLREMKQNHTKSYTEINSITAWVKPDDCYT